MVELADTYGSGPYVSNDLQVQVLLSARTKKPLIERFSSFKKCLTKWKK